MGTVRSEIDDLFLVHAENDLYPLLQQQGQMDERAEATISHPDITSLEVKMNKCDHIYVMSVQWRGQALHEQSCRGRDGWLTVHC